MNVLFWVSEVLLVLVLPYGLLFTILSLVVPVYLIPGLFLILSVCLFRWLVERRQRRERPDLVWLPWYKRIWLTLIPLLFCAYPLVAFGLHYNDPPSPADEEFTQFLGHMMYWGLAFPTILIPRILDNVFSHREAK